MQYSRWISPVVVFLALWTLCVGAAFGNPRLQKAIKHMSDFEIKQAVSILSSLKEQSSLDKSTRAKVFLYLGIGYMYLRKKEKARPAFSQALKLNPGITLPKDTASRIKKYFKTLKPAPAPTPAVPAPTPAAPAPAVPAPAPAAPAPRPAARPAPRKADPLALPIPPRRRAGGMDLGGMDLRLPPVRVKKPSLRVPAFRTRSKVRKPKKPATRLPSVNTGRFRLPTVRRQPAPTLRLPSFRTTPRVRRAKKRKETVPSWNPGRVRFRVPAPKRVTPPLRRSRRFTRKVAKADNPSSLDLDLKVKRPGGGGGSLKTVGWVVAGLAVALAGTGTAFGVMAAGTETEGKDVNTFQTDVPALQESAQSQAMYANIAFGVAGAAAVTAVVLLLLPKKQTGAVSRTRPLQPTRRAVLVRLR